MLFEFETLTVGRLGCNCVVLWEPSSKSGTVIDPGDEAENIAGRVERLGVDVKAILLTHAHFDHVGAAAELQTLWGCPLYLHPQDMPLLDQLDEQTEHFRFPRIQKPRVTPLAADAAPQAAAPASQAGQALLGGELPLKLKVLHTPGHSRGSVAFLAESASAKAGVAIVGDTLFRGGVGRTDLFGGSWDALENSVRTKLYTLDPDTLVIPGHGQNTTIGCERSKNPFVRG
jgi:glyoxylase-like metal-dependent hydrolase (beta-lactamase superfamily II)